MRWYELKIWGLENVPLSHDAVHIHLGLMIFCGLLWILRYKSKAVIYAGLATLAATLMNEALDGYDWYIWTGTVNWVESAKDIMNTMFWPAIAAIFIKLRIKPS